VSSRGPLQNPEAWLDVFTRIGDGVRGVVVPLSGTEAGRHAFEAGAGGDTTVEVDRVAEQVVFSELVALAESGETFSVLSEEAGRRDFGAGLPLILVDPVDGSLNAKQGVPLYGLMLAVLDGPTVADTLAGLVMNLATGQVWTAVRGRGAWRDGQALEVLERADPDRIELLGLESTPRAIKAAQPLVERAAKIRILGSMALSLSLVAAGGIDVFCAPMPVRVFDTAASLLLLRETGGVATTMEGGSVGELPCDLSTRTTLLCAPNRQLHEEALRILSDRR
jgi:myo-inositol-1(or 4)-monophosphatase